MDSISSWILSICGICIVSVLIDTILPTGSTSKYIKSVFSFIVVFIIVSPIPSLINKDFSIDDILNENEIVLQDQYIYQLNRNRLNYYEEKIEKDIKDKGLQGVDISISANIFEINMKIEAIFVDFFDLVIGESLGHINTNELVIDSILKFINIEKEKILFNE